MLIRFLRSLNALTRSSLPLNSSLSRGASSSLRMVSTLPKLPLFDSINNHDPKSTAIVHSASGECFPYGKLLADVAIAKRALPIAAGNDRLEGERVALMADNSYDYVGARWSWDKQTTSDAMADASISNFVSDIGQSSNRSPSFSIVSTL
jgi:hypothetical protein